MGNARKGVCYMVEAARKVLDFERVYAGIIAIGIAAFLFRFLLTFLERKLFPWRKAAAALAGTGAAVPSATPQRKGEQKNKNPRRECQPHLRGSGRQPCKRAREYQLRDRRCLLSCWPGHWGVS